MRADQYERLKVLSELLTDRVLVETNPAMWPESKATKSKYGAKYFNEDRELHWRKKHAMASLGILMRIHSLVNIIERGAIVAPPEPTDEGESDLDREVRDAEREAARLLEKIQKRQRARSN